ncbi:MAG: DUF3102 domain-containing protein [Pirellulales bacterium]|nr:DUF3102 domain-containing protein [Pirellulales bacterium]
MSTAIATTTLGQLAEEINQAHHEAETALNAGLQHAFRAGELLAVAKTRCKHGEWLSWLEDNFDGSVRTAQAYMRVADRREEIESNAQPTALLTLDDALRSVSEPKPEKPPVVPPSIEADDNESEIVEVYEGEEAEEGYEYEELTEEEEVEARNTKPHVAHNGGNNEWYTPKLYIDAVRKVLGGIDLDPASCEEANRVVRANKFYSVEDDGLTQPWAGRVWMNPPYSPDKITAFCEKLITELDDGNVTSACVLVNNATETRWFQGLCHEAEAVCFPMSRVKFWHPNGKTSAPLQGQAILCFGDGAFKFSEVFRHLGVVVHNERFVRSLIC